MSAVNQASYGSRRQFVEDRLLQRPDEIVSASIEMWERLAPLLILIAGEGGFETLYDRNLRLVAERFPALASALPTISRGTQRFEALRASLEAVEFFPASVASLALLDSFLGTLSELIGDAFTYKILVQAWPEQSLQTFDKDMRS